MPLNNTATETPAIVFAYIPAATNTTTTVAGDWYPIAGPFTNSVLVGFELGVDNIIYTGAEDISVLIMYAGVFQTDTNATILDGGVKLNDDVLAGTISTDKMQLTTQYGHVNNVFVYDNIGIKTGDSIQLVIRSDQAGAVLTALTFSTYLTRVVT